MKRRDFITLVGCAAAGWPLAARAQQVERVRRIGIFMGWAEAEADARAWLVGFTQALAELGWNIGRNLQIEVRWVGDRTDLMQILAKELVGLQPDVILSSNTPETAALQRETHTLPIVFVTVSDPVGAGFVANLPRPGGNLTGFMFQEASMVGKLLELLTQIAPGVRRAALMFNPDTAPYVEQYYMPVFESAARSLKVTPIIAPVHDDAEVEGVVSLLGREPEGGLVGAPDRFIQDHRAAIVSFTAKYQVPAAYVPVGLVREGGLVSYGPDFYDQFRRAAPYVDRILRGARPSELPVQLPVKFVVGLNLKTAKALGLTVPPILQATADEVIE
jgi:putative ABC transport system substrate-binding protein